MKCIIFVTLLLAASLLTGCGKNKDTAVDKNENGNNITADEVKIQDNTDLQSLSKELALQMSEGKFSDTYEKCSLAVKRQMSEEALKQAWNATVEGMGNFIEIYEINQEEVKDYQKVVIILRYENNGLKVSFTFNKDGKIDGFWLNYSPIEEEAANTDSYEEFKITFGGSSYPVTGILTMPKNIDKPPVAILIPGSGNHDVNETVGANKPFRDIAWGLAEQGIASIRYNERVLLYPDLAQGKFTIQIDSLNDAADAISYAKTCDKIDQERIFVIGHSLGAMMAPKIAADHSEIAGIVLLAGSPRKLEDIVCDQNRAALANTEGITDTQTSAVMAQVLDSAEEIKNLTKGGSNIILGYPSSYWYSLNQIDIGKLADDLTIPMYIAQGSEDWQVYPDKDFTAWQELLNDNKNVTFKLYDKLNHLFITSNGKTDITEYNTPGKVDKTLISDIADWMNKE